ncbi:MAG: hypothetical protein WA309_01605, partial [Pseudolabrys sp.]
AGRRASVLPGMLIGTLITYTAGNSRGNGHKTADSIALMTSTSIISYHLIGVIEVAHKPVRGLGCIYSDGFW